MHTLKEGYSKTKEMRNMAALKSKYCKEGRFMGQYSFIFIRECLVCNIQFVSKNVGVGRCQTCIDNKKRHKPTNERLERGICECCGKEFEGWVSDTYKLKRTCSGLCQQNLRRRENGESSDSHRSRAKRNGGIVEHVINKRVFIRDKYTCMMCGIKCDPQKTKTHDADSPRLDHIVPLSKGGSHTYCNVQTLCYRCNAKKTNHLPTQVPLFFTNSKGETQIYGIGTE